MPNPGESESRFSYTGIYRALVVNARDPEKRGRVKVWCPDTMPEIEQTRGLWARLANNPIGGRNKVDNRLGDGESTNNADGGEHYFQGSCFIPPVGAWVYIFFEYGNPNEPRILAAGDFGQCKVPIENQQGNQWEKKWTLLKTREGRIIIFSDDPDDERVEITGKKRQLDATDVSGNASSVYTIQDNQTVILIDERIGHEKILIRDYKGNYINLDTESGDLSINVSGDAHIKAGKSIYMTATDEIHMRCGGVLNAQSGNSINIKSAGGQVNMSATSDINIKASGNLNEQADANINIRAGININEDGTLLLQQQGAAGSAATAESAASATPDGERGGDLSVREASELPDPTPTERNVPPPTKVIRETPDVENRTNHKRV